jgi:hypothetical protein
MRYLTVLAIAALLVSGFNTLELVENYLEQPFEHDMEEPFECQHGLHQDNSMFDDIPHSDLELEDNEVVSYANYYEQWRDNSVKS